MNVNINEKKIDPLFGMPPWLRVVGQFSAFGIICCLFVWLIVKIINEQDDGTRFVLQELEKRDDRRDKEIDRRDDRRDKYFESEVKRMSDWNKSISERSSLEFEKVRLELKTLSEQVKLLKDTISMTNKLNQ